MAMIIIRVNIGIGEVFVDEMDMRILFFHCLEEGTSCAEHSGDSSSGSGVGYYDCMTLAAMAALCGGRRRCNRKQNSGGGSE